LVFVGASIDRRLHAYDVETGTELWHGELPASAKATPMSYRLQSGAQYVAVAVGGDDAWGDGDFVVTFRVP
jgi:quinoprotein glucose dehydrogenase